MQTSRLGTATKVNFSQIGGKKTSELIQEDCFKASELRQRRAVQPKSELFSLFEECHAYFWKFLDFHCFFLSSLSRAVGQMSDALRWFLHELWGFNQTISPLKHSKRPLACVYLSYLLLAAQDRAWVLFQQWAHQANHLWTLLELTMNWEGKPQWDAKHSCNFLCLSSLHLREI